MVSSRKRSATSPKGLTSSVQLIEASHQGDVKRALLLLTERRAKADAYNNRALHIAISKGFHEIVHILLQHGAQIDPMLTTEVAQLGRMELLKLLLKYNGGTVHHRAISEAARSGHFHIVQYLLDLSKDYNPNEIFRFAAQHNDLATMQILQMHTDEKVQKEIFRNACQRDDLPLLQSLHSLDPKICSDSLALFIAAKEKHRRIVQYLLDNGALFQPDWINQGIDAEIMHMTPFSSNLKSAAKIS